MIDVGAAIVLLVAGAIAVRIMAGDLYKCATRHDDLQLSHWTAPHAHIFDSSGPHVEDDDSILLFCVVEGCDKTTVLQKVRRK